MEKLARQTDRGTMEEIIKKLQLIPHPEGGFFLETYRAAGKAEDGQCHATAIYCLMGPRNDVTWHRLHGKDKIWHFYAGDPLEVQLASPDGVLLPGSGAAAAGTRIFGTDVLKGHEPQLVVPADHWQSARCLGEWTLFGCTVSPGFEFADFEMADKGWRPKDPERRSPDPE